MLVIFDLDDTLIYTHKVFVEITERFMDAMEMMGIADENMFYTLDGYDKEHIEDAGAYVEWAFPKALRRTYEFYANKHFLDIEDEIGDAVEALGYEYKAVDYETVDGIKTVLNGVADLGHKLVLVSQGEVDEQKRKIMAAGIQDFFEELIVAPMKSAALYEDIIYRYDETPETTWIVGNSLKTEIKPALEIGANCILANITKSWDFEDANVDGEYPVITELIQVLDIIK